MQTIKTQNWYQTPEGAPRGYIDPHALTELWVHTGTACNLQCSFCLEGSAPGDQRLEIPKLDELRPFLEEALSLGVEKFSFTGGEPFLCKELIEILRFASSHRPCLVLTNGTDALQKRLPALIEGLRAAAHPVSFRVSLDYADAARHDAGRGEGNFTRALEGLKQLHRAGFHVSVARHMDKDEDRAGEEAAFATLFAANDLPEDLHLVPFPDFLTPGSDPRVPQVSTDCMTRYQTEASRRAFMCAYSKMLVKQAGQIRVYACTLVDDDPDYDLGTGLSEALGQRISLKHHRCYSCFAYGSSCSE